MFVCFLRTWNCLIIFFIYFFHTTCLLSSADSSGSLADLESSLSKTLNEMAKNAKDIEVVQKCMLEYVCEGYCQGEAQNVIVIII